MEIQYSQLKINHLNDMPFTKAARDGIFSGVFQQVRQGTSQGQEDFELSWYLFFQHSGSGSGHATTWAWAMLLLAIYELQMFYIYCYK